MDANASLKSKTDSMNQYFHSELKMKFMSISDRCTEAFFAENAAVVFKQR